MASTLVGLFDDRDAAQTAVSDLISAGISRDKISVVANDGSGGTATHNVDESGNLAAAGASSGASSGAVVGGVAGLLIGLGFTVLPIAGILLAGPIAGLIAGAASGAVTGGVVGGLLGLGIPKEHAELYAEGIRRGGTLVTVTADSSDESRIRDILDRDGATDIEERAASWKSQGFTGYDASAKPYSDEEFATERNTYTAPTYTAPAAAETTATVANYTAPVGDKIEIVEEQLQVGKREVERGGLRVRSFVTEKPVSEQITLREEHVDIQRTAVDRPATGDAFREGTIEMRETAEVPVVAKEARVVEEIALGKTATERTETVSDTIRRTDVEIENVGTTSAYANDSDYDTEFRSHFSSNNPGGNFDRHAPAYAYGKQLANDPAYSGGDWNSNETSYRSRWEEKNPGTWDEFKSSVQHAFEKAKNAVTGNNATVR